MNVVLVIDSNGYRRHAMQRLIGPDRCTGAECAPQKDANENIVFIHASDDKQRGWREFVTASSPAKWVVMYGGEGVTGSLLRADDPRIDLSQSVRWLTVESPVGETPERSDWHPREFIDAIGAGETDPSKLASILTGFDPVLEAKLDFLYECLDACLDSGRGQVPRLADSRSWQRVLRAFENNQDGKEALRKALESMEAVTDRDDRLDKLKDLRDALLD